MTDDRWERQGAPRGPSDPPRRLETLPDTRAAPTSGAPDAAAAAAIWPLLLETVTVVERDGSVRWVSGDTRGGILGYEAHAFTGTSLFDLVHPDDRDRALRAWEEVLAHATRSVGGELRVRAADGTYQHVEAEAHNRLDDPALRGIVLCTRNVTTRVVAAEGLADAPVTRALVEAAADVALLFDRDGTRRYGSPGLRRALGWELDDVPDLLAFVDLVAPGDALRALDMLERLRRAPGRRIEETLRVRHRDGSTRVLEVRMVDRPATGDDEVEGLLLVGHDVTAHAEALREESASLRDPATGVVRRTLLLDRLGEALHRLHRDGTQLLLLVVDFPRDERAPVTSAEETTQLDREIVERLVGVVRPGDTIARLGPDRFAVLCPDLWGDALAASLPRWVERELRAPLPVGAGTRTLAPRLGVVVTDRATAAPEDLLRDAESSLGRDDGS